MASLQLLRGFGRAGRRTLMSNAVQSLPARGGTLPRDAPRLRYTSAEHPDEPVTIAWTSDGVFAQGDGRKGVRALRPITLRDGCGCGRCRDPVSGNKTFASWELPDGLAIAHVEAGEAGLAVTFSDDVARLADGDGRHRTLVPWRTVEVALRRRGAREPGGDGVAFPRRRALAAQTGVRYWDRAVLEAEGRCVDFGAWMAGGDAFWDAVIDLCRLGLVVVRGVPRAERSVVDVATRLAANLRETLYGRTFDVRARPPAAADAAAANVAYTAAALPLHQDLLYLDAPPMVQVLHCLDNSCAGGESLFSDGLRAAHLLAPFVAASARLGPLAHHAVPYHYVAAGFRYHALRPVLSPGGLGAPDLFWSPPFQAPPERPARDLRPWVEAARFLERRLLAASNAVFRLRLRPGDCVVFDNLRVLHGRTAFDPAAGGARWLRGAYVAADDFLSRAAHMPLARARARGGPDPWTPELAAQQLRLSDWHARLRKDVCDFDPAVARRLVR